MATFRCQANTTRLEMKLRCPERSTSDLVRIYIAPANHINPQPAVGAELVSGSAASHPAVLKTFRLACLCQHVRCPPFEWEGQHHSRLTFSGGFSLADAHNWVASCLPNVPDKIPVVEGDGPDDSISFFFVCRQWETALSCHYRRGQVDFLSDNAVALSYVREFISREATSVKNIQLSIIAGSAGGGGGEQEATADLVRRLHPRLTELAGRKDRAVLCAALREAATDQLAQDSSSTVSDWMTEEFRTILQTCSLPEDEDPRAADTFHELQSTLGHSLVVIGSKWCPKLHFVGSRCSVTHVAHVLC